MPPFSVINSRQPYFRERLRFWQDMGLRSSSGRSTNMAYDNRRLEKWDTTHRVNPLPDEIMPVSGTSIFNPVLCEILYKWFTVPQSRILDPFAGGFVRGAIASLLGHSYVGFDVSEKQIKTNLDDYAKLQNKVNFTDNTIWVCDTSANIDKLVRDDFDMVLTCPPYYNLEVYSNNPLDISTLPTYKQFLAAYKDILVKTSSRLKQDSFFVIVVSDVRDKKTTEYLGFVSDTIHILRDYCKLQYYNEIIMYNDTGNLAITSGNYMNKARKVGRQHQNILVFYKGDITHIKDKFKPLSED